MGSGSASPFPQLEAGGRRVVCPKIRAEWVEGEERGPTPELELGTPLATTRECHRVGEAVL